MANKDIKFLQEQTDGSFLEVNVAATADSLLSFSNTSEPEAVLKSIFVTGAPWQSEGYVTGTPWTSEGYVVNSGTVPLTSDEMAWYVNASVVMTAGNIGQYAYTGDGSAFATAAQGALADTAVQGTPWQSEGYYVGDGSAFATAAQGALADTAVQGTPWQSEGYVTGTPWQSEGYYVGDGSAFATAAQGSAADTAYGWGDHSQAGYSTFNPNQAGSLENSSGIFDGGALTNGVSIGGGFVRLPDYGRSHSAKSRNHHNQREKSNHCLQNANPVHCRVISGLADPPNARANPAAAWPVQTRKPPV